MKKRKVVDDEPDNRLIGYARVSTDDQDLSAQIAALSRAGVMDDNMHKDQASGVSRRRDRQGDDRTCRGRRVFHHAGRIKRA